ncbi:MAG: hypothetical protein J2P20_13820 [Pseudonocardia sp.]|nr:hypothetical protein [Pseudonocardia sp.]MBO0872782.1 hypothetical protein [Pseudonocardia sp.]
MTAAEPPALLVLDGGAAADLVREVCAGVEEEGVPVRVVPGVSGDADRLGAEAADRSALQVGIGLDPLGTVVVRHALMSRHGPVHTLAGGGRTGWRRAGRIAARIITGLPLD